MIDQNDSQPRLSTKKYVWVVVGSFLLIIFFVLFNGAWAGSVEPDEFVFLPIILNGDEAVLLEGYGTDSTFGGGVNSEDCVVTSLANSGTGTLRDCIENRNGPIADPIPRTITFAVAGTIVLQSSLPIRQPYLTVDGLSAPAPGITIEKAGDGDFHGLLVSTRSTRNTCGHDVLIQGLRLVGVWTRDTEDHSQSGDIFVLDGEDLPGCIRNIVLSRSTLIDGQDSAGDMWGSASNVTFQYNAFIHNFHPSNINHSPGGEAQVRENINLHHNLFAYSHERNPQIRGAVRNFNFDQNILHMWDAYGFPGGYGVRVRCLDAECPERLNFMNNHWTMASPSPELALLVGNFSGNVNDPDEAIIAPQLFTNGNFLPPQNIDSGTAVSEFPRPAIANVTLYEDNALIREVLPKIGVPHRTTEELSIFEEVTTQIEQDLD